MKYLDISNTSERMIKFGLSMPNRYKEGDFDTDPWWNVHLIVKKDCEKKKIEFSFAQESMTTYELKDLVKEIEKALLPNQKEKMIFDTMEPDFRFEFNGDYGTMYFNLAYADTLSFWLEREDFVRIKDYIKNFLDEMNVN